MRKMTMYSLAFLLVTGSASADLLIKSLYDRLGGKEAIVAVIDDFVGNVGQDARIKKYFEGSDIKRLKSQLVDQVCEAAGGPCKYKGQNMKNAHQGMGIKSSEFDALVEDLKKTLDKFKVPTNEQNDLLAVLGPLKKDIVEK